MRWQRLFADMEAQIDQQQLIERDDELAELIEGERASQLMRDFLKPGPVRLRVAGFGDLAGTAMRITADWLLINSVRSEMIVNIDMVIRIDRAADRPATMAMVDQRTTWLHAARALMRDRSRVHVVSVDGSTVDGIVRSAAKDFLELQTDQQQVVMLAYRSIGVVVSRADRWSEET